MLPVGGRGVNLPVIDSSRSDVAAYNVGSHLERLKCRERLNDLAVWPVSRFVWREEMARPRRRSGEELGYDESTG